MTPSKFKRKLSDLPRNGKQFLLIGFDAAALVFVAWAAYALRLDHLYNPTIGQWRLILLVPVIAIPIFIKMGLYRAIIRYLPDQAIWTIVRAVTFTTLIWVAIAFLTQMTGAVGIPRSIPVLFWGLATLVIGGSRFGAKWLLSRRGNGRPSGKRTIIYGTDDAAMQLANALRNDAQRNVIGFVSDEPGLIGMSLAGLRVYSPATLEDMILRQAVAEVIVVSPTRDGARRRELIARLSGHETKFRILPAIGDIASGKFLVNYVRDIDIDDLLGRSPVPADPVLLQSVIKENTILVTGAAGSIGSELANTIAGLAPSKLVILDFDEHGLYELDRKLGTLPGLNLVPVLGTVTDAGFVERTLRQHGVRTVFHCAAYKHVPLVEANKLEGIRNNVVGTRVLCEKAVECGVENFILISSDKAVRPTSVMGATKRWSELIVRHYGELARKQGERRNFASVRFGNVLGSSGSVVPLFKEQIANGGPVTVTHADMKRYFMSIREATELIIQAAGLSDPGDILLLEMGEAVGIRALAEEMIMLAGHSVRGPDNPDGIEIVTIGARDGEKFHEELFYDPSGVTPTTHPKILRAKRRDSNGRDVPAALEKLDALIAAGDEKALRDFLFDFVRT